MIHFLKKRPEFLIRHEKPYSMTIKQSLRECRDKKENKDFYLQVVHSLFYVRRGFVLTNYGEIYYYY
jgi:hypothetical protein